MDGFKDHDIRVISKSRYFDNFSLLYILVQAVLYIAFLYIDITGTGTELSNGIKFTVIVLCFCYVLFYRKSTDKSILFYLRAALLFTVISDLCLLLLDYYQYGVMSFVVVQQLYGIKLDYERAVRMSYREDTKRRFLEFILRFFAQAVLTVLVCFILKSQGINLELLLIITVFYFLSIVTNVIRAVGSAYRPIDKISSHIFAAGMVLFLLCDINVGIFNLTDYLSLPQSLYDRLYAVSAILMWTFYAPSQLLISLSAKRKTAE